MGSEMCIRDSFGVTDAGGADAGGADSGGADAGGADAGGADAGGADAGGGNTPDDSGLDSGVVTDAVPDTAEVDQGQTVLIDVLENDTDAAGLGLTLVSVESSPNATVSIQNGLIEYTPNFGFFGTDTFIYTITDANGVEASATVTVEVNRFSDINDNGINDFVECNCSSLQLETGVHGSGLGGGTIQWPFLILIGMFGLVRRKAQALRKSNYRNNCKRNSWSA